MASKKGKALQKANTEILRRTLSLMVVCGILAFIVLGAHLYKIQVRDHDYYEERAIEQQLRETTINASRGTIYDRNMKILAMSASVETVFISPVELKMYNEDPEFISRGLSEIIGVDYDSLMKKWEDTRSWYKTVAVKLEKEVADKVRAFKNDNNLKSVHLEVDTKRYYPYSSLASHIIGFVGTDNTGLYGIEAGYEDYLKGTSGRIIRATTSNGTDMLYTKFENYIDAKNGNNAILTIDANIQYYLEKHLQQAIDDYAIRSGGMGIVMNVKTGEILGMATLGNFDLNNYQEISDEAKQQLEGLTGDDYLKGLAQAQISQWRNRTISDTYEPGSTFKIFTLAAALEEGLVNDNSTFFCGGAIDVIGRDTPIHCWKHGGHGSQNLSESVQHSCNVAFVNIGLKVGAETFYEYMEALGFFDKTEIDLIGEGSSLWWDRQLFTNPKNLSQLAAASFGQTFNITPLQLITAVSAVANDGKLMRPYVVSKVVDDDGNVIMANEPKVVRQVISEVTSKKVCEILETVVDGGASTGRNAYVAGYRIGGKTATSEKVGQGMADDYIVSFVGIAPTDDPELAVLVLLDSPDPSTGIYVSGGIMAAPAVGKIFADALPYLGVKTVYKDEELATINVTVPNVKNMGVEEAKAELQKDKNFTVRVVGNGDTVTDQVPAGNVTVSKGTEVIIYAGETKPTVMVTVPSLYGKTYVQAKSALEAAGLYIRTAGVAASTTSDTIVVSDQSIAQGNEVAYGTVVEVTLFESDTSLMETRG